MRSLSVFLKVLNEAEGYCPDHPHIAHMERYLSGKGKLETFEEAFRAASGLEWVEERDAYQFNHDEVIQAWMAATGQSKEAAERWIDGAEESFSLSVENFSRWVREYLDKRGTGHRIIFLVDEVGQFVGSDTHLMLNLQTITENLGTACQGRAWVAVTSQEDIDSVLGEMRVTRANDFSKIQGRFRTRLSLSSANVDEVIQERLLAKLASVEPDLKRVFNEQGRHPEEPAHLRQSGHDLPAISRMPTTSPGTTLSPLISSSSYRRSSRRSAKLGPPAFIYRGGSAPSWTPFSQQDERLPTRRSMYWSHSTNSTHRSRAFSIPRSRRPSTRRQTTAC